MSAKCHEPTFPDPHRTAKYVTDFFRRATVPNDAGRVTPLEGPLATDVVRREFMA